MAAPGVTIKRAEQALQRIVESVPELAARLGVEPVAIPTFGRDLNYLHADQLDAIATNLERLLVATDPTPAVLEPEDFSLLTKAELVQRLELFGVTGIDKEDHKKDELVTMVEAARDGQLPDIELTDPPPLTAWLGETYSRAQLVAWLSQRGQPYDLTEDQGLLAQRVQFALGGGQVLEVSDGDNHPADG